MAEDENKNDIPVWAFEAIEIEKPNPKWYEKGMKEKEELVKLLCTFGVNKVEHIGSTAILNLPAKPIIDLMASVPSLYQIVEIV